MNIAKSIVFIFTAMIYSMPFQCMGMSFLTIDNTPSTILQNGVSQLYRPEGVAFSPSGDYVATANLFANSIMFYRREGISGSIYKTTPAYSIQGVKSKLHLPHDLSFSPDGRHLAVANRQANSITIYAKNQKGTFRSQPIAIIQGQFSELSTPSSVRYSPEGNILAVANTESHTITFYRYRRNEYSQKPYQIIKDEHLLTSVNSLDFSKDGKLLAVADIEKNTVHLFQKNPNSENLYSSSPVQTLQGQDSNLCCPHSLSFHPIEDYLVVSNAQGRNNINVFKKIADGPFYEVAPILTMQVIEMYKASNLDFIDQLHKKGGCKGVAFSPDGTSLAITQNLTADGVQVPISTSMLLIYPVKATNP